MSIKDQMASGNTPYGDRLLQWEADRRMESLTAQNKLLAEAVVALARIAETSEAHHDCGGCDDSYYRDGQHSLWVKAEQKHAPAIALATQITGENHDA